MGISAGIVALDAQVFDWSHQVTLRWPYLNELAAWLANQQLVKYGPFASAICWLWFSPAPDRERRRVQLAEGMFLAFAALVLGRVLALVLPFRERPFLDQTLHFFGGGDYGLRTWSSFPSDHAVMAFALAASLYRLSPRIGLLTGLHAAIFICLPRLILGLHYPSDLIGGGLIGVALVAVSSRLQALHAAFGRVVAFEHKRPEVFYTLGFLALFEITTMLSDLRLIAVVTFRHLVH